MTEPEANKTSYDFSYAKIAGIGTQGSLVIGSTFNDYSVVQNMDEINNLIASLRQIIENLPKNQRDDALTDLDDLEEDLKDPKKRQPNRIKKRLAGLLAIAGVIGTNVATATDFTNNVFDLADKLGFRIEQVQPQSAQQIPPIEIKLLEP